MSVSLLPSMIVDGLTDLTPESLNSKNSAKRC